MLTVLSNLVQYYAYCDHARFRTAGCTGVGPTICILVAAILLMVHPTMYLLKDLRIIIPTCKDKWGMRAIYGCTHVGFFHLLVGTFWAVGGLEGVCPRSEL
mmetsp:Transcript_122236/g.317693  ORF Transcript_122236/g.317693 Transcript_122236/m.317693 type:complete len:101 (-) Transcript_122236:9-311(-)